MAREINKGNLKMIEGINKAVDAIKTTLGPSGKCVAIQGIRGPEITRDGATVAKSIVLKDSQENMGAQLVRSSAENTENQAGDGTSGTSILIQEIIKNGLSKMEDSNVNVNEMKSGILKAGEWVKKYVKEKAISIDGDLEKIRKVATISANNDPQIGDLIVECMDKVGINGVITADLYSGLETTVDITTGMKLDRGWASPNFVTSAEDGKCIMENPYILVIGEKISNVSQILPIIEQIIDPKRGGSAPFLIICDDMDETVMTTLIINTMQGAVRCCVVKGIDYGDARKNLMSDVATGTGATFICQENGIGVTEMTIRECGKANRVVISRDSCIIYDGYGDKDEITERLGVLRKRMTDPSVSDYDKTKFEKRIAALSEAISIIRAGGATEEEKNNRKQTIEDAILASKSAIAEGAVPGGGYVFYHASLDIKKDKLFWNSLKNDERIGAEVLVKSLPIILKTIISNSGVSAENIIKSMEKSTKGYNAKTGKMVDLVSDGVLDSAKVLRVSLENATSAASMALLTSWTITDIQEEAKE